MPGLKDDNGKRAAPGEAMAYQDTWQGPPGEASGSVARDAIKLRGELQRGTSVGRYLVLDKLGAGGMGVVYAAYDPELDRKIALKLLHDRQNVQGDLTVGRSRLLREAQAMARLSHPNVISVFDVGTIDEQVFVAMEFVDGGTLGEWGREKPRSWQQILPLFLLAGRGLQAAHAAGLVHRDFKPDNVLLGSDHRVRVTDFGLAQSSTESGKMALPQVALQTLNEFTTSGKLLLSTPLTQTGAFMGSPRYMAPEQFRQQPADHRTDQFSFCVALYEALYRQPPFPGETFGALLLNVSRGQVLPPPRDSRVPAWLRRILLRGMSVSPADRYPSVEALLHELSRDRQRTQKRVLLAGALLLLAGAGTYAYAALRPDPGKVCRGSQGRLDGVWDEAARKAMQQAFLATRTPFAAQAWKSTEWALNSYADKWVKMHTEACLSTHVRGEQSASLLDLRMGCLNRRLEAMSALTGLFQRADATIVEKAVQAAGALPPMSTCADIASLTAKVPPPEDRTVRARTDELHRKLAEAEALRDGGKYKEGLALSQATTAAARPLKYKPLLSEALYLQGDLLSLSGNNDGAAPVVYEAILAGIEGRHHEVEAQAMTLYALVIGYYQNQPEVGQKWGQVAQAVIEAEGSNDAIRGTLLNALGLVSCRQKHYGEALDYFQRALSLRKKALGGMHEDVAATLNNLGVLRSDEHRYEEALEYHRQALHIKEQVLGPDHPDVAISYYNIGTQLRNLQRYDEALKSHMHALEIRRKVLDPGHPILAESLNNLGDVLTSMGRHDEARKRYEEALEMRIKAYGPDSPKVALFHVNLGNVLARQGHPAEALEHHRQALFLRQKAALPDDPKVAEQLVRIGEDLLALHRGAEAIAPLEQALRMYLPHPPEPKDAADARLALGQALYPDHKQRKRALSLLMEARAFYVKEGPDDQGDVSRVDAFLADPKGRHAGSARPTIRDARGHIER